MVASEINGSPQSHGGSHSVVVFDGHARVNRGASDDWGTAKLFFAEALRIAGEAFGVVSLRGKPLPYLRLRRLFGTEGEAPERENVVVVQYGAIMSFILWMPSLVLLLFAQRFVRGNAISAGFGV